MKVIDADKLRKKFDENLTGFCRDVVLHVIDETPGIRGEGHWLWADGQFYCSECEAVPMTEVKAATPDGLLLVKQWVEAGKMADTIPFCPMCGAKMSPDPMVRHEYREKVAEMAEEAEDD